MCRYLARIISCQKCNLVDPNSHEKFLSIYHVSMPPRKRKAFTSSYQLSEIVKFIRLATGFTCIDA